MSFISKPIIIIGAMGCGKTSIGHRLSCVIKHDFFDTDNELVKRTGVSISHIFDIEGETGFRKRETQILTELCGLKNIVLATGGGIVLAEENRKIMQQGIVIYLQASVEQLLKQTTNSRHRPLLEKSNDREQTIKEILTQRTPLYESCADVIITIEEKQLYMIINEIKAHIKKGS